jgi:hypothetical protein
MDIAKDRAAPWLVSALLLILPNHNIIPYFLLFGKGFWVESGAVNLDDKILPLCFLWLLKFGISFNLTWATNCNSTNSATNKIHSYLYITFQLLQISQILLTFITTSKLQHLLDLSLELVLLIKKYLYYSITNMIFINIY